MSTGKEGAFCLGFIIGGLLIFCVADYLSTSAAIDYGIAHYDSKTGDLIWHELPKEKTE